MSNPNAPVRFLTLDDAAARVGLTRHTIREWLRQRKLASFRPGKRVLVRESDLIAIVEASEQHKDGAR